VSLHIDSIRIDGGTQSRASINEATVAEYAEAMADPATVFPPVIAYFDGREYWLADGFHRLAAWRQIGRTDIPAEIRQGDRRAAILHSVAANSAHGLRRTNDDKRRAVLTLLEDAEWSQWSDREIARRCAVHHEMVGKLRASLTGGSASDARTYTTKHGTTATMNTANIGAGKAVTDRQEITSEAQENKAEKVVTVDDGNQSSVQPEEDPETANARKALAALTRTGLEDEVIGLRADLAEAKRKNAEQRAEIARLKGLNAAFNGDKDEVIRRLNKTIEHKNSEMYRANEKADAAMRQVHVLKKRVAELEQMGIAL
jgi:hypothetical protein